MLDRIMNGDIQEREPFGAALAERLQSGRDKGANAEEDSCPAFGFLRGERERALAIEFRQRTGTRVWFPYSWLGPWRFNASAGLLLKFTGDIVSLVWIRGSNLDLVLPQKSVNLTDRGLQRHRILWVREMDEEELRTTAENGPTIDRIDIVDFEAHEELCEWVKTNAPAFLR